jgi:hypothetical protein
MIVFKIETEKQKCPPTEVVLSLRKNADGSASVIARMGHGSPWVLWNIHPTRGCECASGVGKELGLPLTSTGRVMEMSLC